MSSHICNLLYSNIEQCNIPTSNTSSSPRFLIGSKRKGNDSEYELTQQVLTESEAISRLENSNIDSVVFQLVQTTLKVEPVMTKRLVIKQ